MGSSHRARALSLARGTAEQTDTLLATIQDKGSQDKHTAQWKSVGLAGERVTDRKTPYNI